MRVFLTGIAGFIGFHQAKSLLNAGFEVIGIDNINDYYSIGLKLDRLNELGIQTDSILYSEKNESTKYKNLTFYKIDLSDYHNLEKIVSKYDIDYVINLAAQAGVRYSLINPHAYIDSNVKGFLNLLEIFKDKDIKHFVFASSSSVYGESNKQPFKVENNTDQPISLYAATKKSNELLAHTYSHIYGMRLTGLRFFTVYGPWGRPDMAYFKFAKSIVSGKTIDVYNHGKMKRDFTYIDDIVQGVQKVCLSEGNNQKYNIYNIGNNKPVALFDFIKEIESALGIKANIELKPLQAGDVVETYADISNLINEFDYKPNTPISIGINKFIDWFKVYYPKYFTKN